MSQECEDGVKHVGRMDLEQFFVCADCGLTLSSWSSRHQVRRLDEQFVELDQPCPICRTNRWSVLHVIGVLETDDEFPEAFPE